MAVSWGGLSWYRLPPSGPRQGMATQAAVSEHEDIQGSLALPGSGVKGRGMHTRYPQTVPTSA